MERKKKSLIKTQLQLLPSNAASSSSYISAKISANSVLHRQVQSVPLPNLCAAGEFPSSIVMFVFLSQARNGKPIVFPLTPNLKSTTSFCSMRHKGSTQPGKPYPQTRSSTKVSGINFVSLAFFFSSTFSSVLCCSI